MKKPRQILALLLVAVLMCTQLHIMVLATDEGEGGENIPSGTIPEDITSDTPQSNNMAGNTHTGIVTYFNGLPDEIRWQNTDAPVFPETVSGMVDGEATEIPVTWEADHEFDTDLPESGLYVFTSRMAEGYTLSDGVEVPRITVYIPARMMLMRMAGDDTNSALQQFLENVAEKD